MAAEGCCAPTRWQNGPRYAGWQHPARPNAQSMEAVFPPLDNGGTGSLTTRSYPKKTGPALYGDTDGPLDGRLVFADGLRAAGPAGRCCHTTLLHWTFSLCLVELTISCQPLDTATGQSGDGEPGSSRQKRQRTGLTNREADNMLAAGVGTDDHISLWGVGLSSAFPDCHPPPGSIPRSDSC
jgi:hypothetical protein